MGYLLLMGIEEELARRASEAQALLDGNSAELAHFHERLIEFNALMQKNGVLPEALYDIQFLRQVRKARTGGALRAAQSGIDEYQAKPVLDVWFVSIDYQDWSGPSTGKALTTDGRLARWTTDHKPVRQSTGGLGGGGLSVEQTYIGIRARSGPSFLNVPAVLAAPPTPLTQPPICQGSDGLAELAEFYLGRTTQRPGIYVP